MQHRRGNEAHNAALEAEHWLAWFLSALAILLAVLGLLRAYGIIGPENTTAAGQVTSISPGGLPDTYWDGGLLLLAALSSALLAFALHRNDHHRMRDLAAIPDREENLWKTEHLLAYVMVVDSVAFATQPAKKDTAKAQVVFEQQDLHRRGCSGGLRTPSWRSECEAQVNAR